MGITYLILFFLLLLLLALGFVFFLFIFICFTAVYSETNITDWLLNLYDSVNFLAYFVIFTWMQQNTKQLQKKTTTTETQWNHDWTNSWRKEMIKLLSFWMPFVSIQFRFAFQIM